MTLEKFDTPFRSVAIFTFVFMAVRHLMLWSSPDAGDAATIYSLSMLMAFEFVMVHSGAFMSALSGSKLGLLGLVVFYGLFAFGFNYAMPNNDIAFVYMFVVLNRVRFFFYKKNEDSFSKTFIESIIRLLVYFFLVIPITLSNEYIPALGLTEEYLTSSGYQEIRGNSSGVFIEKPQVALLFGFVYYSVLAGLELRTILKSRKIKAVI
jgi:hypothetical protein